MVDFIPYNILFNRLVYLYNNSMYHPYYIKKEKKWRYTALIGIAHMPKNGSAMAIGYPANTRKTTTENKTRARTLGHHIALTR